MNKYKWFWIAVVVIAISKDPVLFAVAVSQMIAGICMAALCLLGIGWLGNKIWPSKPIGELRIDFEVEQGAFNKDMADAEKAIERLRSKIESRNYIVIDMGVWGK